MSSNKTTGRRRRFSVVTVPNHKVDAPVKSKTNAQIDKTPSKIIEKTPSDVNNQQQPKEKEKFEPKPPNTPQRSIRRNQSVKTGMTVSVSVNTLKRHNSLESFQREIAARRANQHVTENMVHEEVESDIDKYYVRKKHVLGSGISGDVRTCVHRGTGRRFALKKLDKQNLSDTELSRLNEEIRIMAQLDHPNIVRLYESFETPTEIYLVMELLTGGDLFDRLTGEMEHQLSEARACQLIQTILNAVRYCHGHNIVHRDLKLENFLFENDKSDAQLKLIDFGFSLRMTEDEVLTDSLGTAYYVAPEVLEKNYSKQCDIWSIGVITYMLLTGTPPFDGPNDAEVLNAVRAGRVVFHSYLFEHVSDLAKDFIRRCLTFDPARRPNAEEAQRHPWFLSIEETLTEPLSADILKRLKTFRQKFALSRLCMEAVAFALTPHQIKSLRAEFSKFDLDSTGSITFEGLKNVLEADGSLNANEIAEIFDGIDFEGTGRIHYHELIAAMLTRNHAKEETLKIAFDRMSHHKEYITYADIRDLLGRDYTDEEAEAMLNEMNFHVNAQINFTDFKDIMRGSQRVQFSFQRQRKENYGSLKSNVVKQRSTDSNGRKLSISSNDGFLRQSPGAKSTPSCTPISDALASVSASAAGTSSPRGQETQPKKISALWNGIDPVPANASPRGNEQRKISGIWNTPPDLAISKGNSSLNLFVHGLRGYPEMPPVNVRNRKTVPGGKPTQKSAARMTPTAPPSK